MKSENEKSFWLKSLGSPTQTCSFRGEACYDLRVRCSKPLPFAVGRKKVYVETYFSDVIRLLTVFGGRGISVDVHVFPFFALTREVLALDYLHRPEAKVLLNETETGLIMSDWIFTAFSSKWFYPKKYFSF